MIELEEFNKLYRDFKESDIFIPDNLEEREMIEYVYESNKLEGNKLSLLETTRIITDDVAMGNKKLMDYLEAKGHYKALRYVVIEARKGYGLDEKL